MELTRRSRELRINTIKLSKANGGYHYGGSFSCCEILIALFDSVMTPNDDFVLSKGHACWPYYVLLREKGYQPRLEGHPVRDPQNGVLCTTGSLGHGFPTAVGLALAKSMKDNSSGRVFVLLGDGECQAGTTWESLLIGSKLGLNNLVVIVDWNGIQGSDYIKNVLPLTKEVVIALAESLHWEVFEVDGHDIHDITAILSKCYFQPVLVIAETIKGKGVSFMENDPAWHSKWLDPEHERIAFDELMSKC